LRFAISSGEKSLVPFGIEGCAIVLLFKNINGCKGRNYQATDKDDEDTNNVKEDA